jgi:soluble lytic murein transglycosylase-like protein
MDVFNNNYYKAIMAYNFGVATIKKSNLQPPKGAINYVNKVYSNYYKIKGGYLSVNI